MQVLIDHLHGKLTQGPWTHGPSSFGKDAVEYRMEIAPGVAVVVYRNKYRVSVYATRTVNGETKGLCKSTKIEWADGVMESIFKAIAETATLAYSRTGHGPKKEETVATAPAPLALPVIPEFKFKKDRLSWFKATLATDIAFAYECLLTIFSMQTASEQAALVTVEHNGVGFSGVDAEIFSSFAKQLLSRRTGNPAARLSVKQEALLLKRMPKYARQYSEIGTPVSVVTTGDTGPVFFAGENTNENESEQYEEPDQIDG